MWGSAVGQMGSRNMEGRRGTNRFSGNKKCHETNRFRNQDEKRVNERQID